MVRKVTLENNRREKEIFKTLFFHERGVEKMKKSLAVFTLCFFGVFALAVGQAIAVDVYAEGAYTDTDVVVYIYADVGSGETPLRSAGVTLSYDPTALANPVAVKNVNDWYLGDESYMDPDVSLEGQVIFILGKLNPDYPADGVPAPGQSGARVLLGTVAFDRLAGSSPPFSLGLDYGKRGGPDPGDPGKYTFKNFVDTDQVALDDVSVNFIPVSAVYERGDANANGGLESADMFAVRNLLGTGVYKCFADCNGNGNIESADMFCIRGKL